MAQPRSITLVFTQPDPASFIQGLAAAFLLFGRPSLLSLAYTTSTLPEASTIRAFLGFAAMPCGLYAIITAVMERETISSEEEKEKKGNDKADRSDSKPRDDSVLSPRSEMWLAAYVRTARWGCLGGALLIGGFGVWIASIVPSCEIE